MNDDPLHAISLIAVSGQLLLEAENRCAELEAELATIRQTLIDMQNQTKADKEVMMLHHAEEKARMLADRENERKESVGLAVIKDAIIARQDEELKRERVEKAELRLGLSRIAETIAKEDTNEIDIGEIKINFERGQDGRIKSPLRIN